MTYEAKQAVYLPVADFLNLEFHLMDTRPGVKPDVFVTELVPKDAMRGASSGYVFLGTITGSVPPIAGRGLRKG